MWELNNLLARKLPLALVGLRAQELFKFSADLVSGRKVSDVRGQQARLLTTLDVGVILTLQSLDDLGDLLGARDLLKNLGPVKTCGGDQILSGDIEPRRSHEGIEPQDSSVGELRLSQVMGHMDREPERVVAGLAKAHLQQRRDAARHLHGTEEGLVLTNQLGRGRVCLLYTSDAADDLTRVDLGGR